METPEQIRTNERLLTLEFTCVVRMATALTA